MGLATFTYEQDWDHWPIIVVAIVAMLISRLFNIYPNAFLVNCYRPDKKKIPKSYQHIMWFSGLRGAIAFALGLEAAEGYAIRADTDTPGAGLCILTITLSIVIFTVLSMGGAVFTVLNYYDSPEVSVFEAKEVLEDDTADAAMMKERQENKALGFDRRWFKPFFTWRYQDETKTTASER
jgi:sodium/hydrogen exchanger 8